MEVYANVLDQVKFQRPTYPSYTTHWNQMHRTLTFYPEHETTFHRLFPSTLQIRNSGIERTHPDFIRNTTYPILKPLNFSGFRTVKIPQSGFTFHRVNDNCNL